MLTHSSGISNRASTNTFIKKVNKARIKWRISLNMSTKKNYNTVYTKQTTYDPNSVHCKYRFFLRDIWQMTNNTSTIINSIIKYYWVIIIFIWTLDFSRQLYCMSIRIYLYIPIFISNNYYITGENSKW